MSRKYFAGTVAIYILAAISIEFISEDLSLLLVICGTGMFVTALGFVAAAKLSNVSSVQLMLAPISLFGILTTFGLLIADVSTVDEEVNKSLVYATLFVASISNILLYMSGMDFLPPTEMSVIAINIQAMGLCFSIFDVLKDSSSVAAASIFISFGWLVTVVIALCDQNVRSRITAVAKTACRGTILLTPLLLVISGVALLIAGSVCYFKEECRDHSARLVIYGGVFASMGSLVISYHK